MILWTHIFVMKSITRILNIFEYQKALVELIFQLILSDIKLMLNDRFDQFYQNFKGFWYSSTFNLLVILFIVNKR